MQINGLRYSIGETSSLVLKISGDREEEGRIKEFLDWYFLKNKEKFEREEWESKEYNQQINYFKGMNNKACFRTNWEKHFRYCGLIEMGINYNDSKKEVSEFYNSLKTKFSDADWSKNAKQSKESLEKML